MHPVKRRFGFRNLLSAVCLAACLITLSSACSSILGDFDVQATDGDASTTSGDGSNQQGDGAGPGPGSQDATVGADGALVCSSPSMGDCDNTPANGCETDLRTTGAHCGACGRDCGAAMCENGECKAEKLAEGLPRPFGLEIAGPRIVWHEGAAIQGCRIADCAASKAVLVDVTGSVASQPSGVNSPRVIAAQGQNFFFSQCPGNLQNDCSVARCDVAGCKQTGATYLQNASGNRRATLLVGVPNAIYTHQGLDGLIRSGLPMGPFAFENAKWKIGDQLQAFHQDPQRVLWLDDNASMANPTGGLFLCPPTGCVAAPTRLLPPPVRHLAIAPNSSIAFTSSGTAATASIVSCDAAGGCGSAGTLLAPNQAYVADIAVDESNVYWSTIGAASFMSNAAAIGTVMKCALPTCAGGPKKVAENLLNPVSVRIDQTHGYWTERGSQNLSNGTIPRRRK
jgi:hypothetical protein